MANVSRAIALGGKIQPEAPSESQPEPVESQISSWGHCVRTNIRVFGTHDETLAFGEVDVIVGSSGIYSAAPDITLDISRNGAMDGWELDLAPLGMSRFFDGGKYRMKHAVGFVGCEAIIGNTITLSWANTKIITINYS